MPKILIVDDDLDLLEITKSLLVRKGFEVETSASSEDAYQKIENFSPQIILLDVFLSGVDGLATCRKLKNESKTSGIPIVIVSGYPRGTESIIYDYGADDFIAKPFEINELITKVHSILSHKTVSD